MGDVLTITHEPTQSDSVTPSVPPASTAKQPDLILGKFKTQDDLVKAYSELEKKIGQPKEEAKPATEPAKPTTPKEPADKSKAPEPVAEPKPNFAIEAFEEEYASSGKLSDKTYEKLAKDHGIDKAQVDQYIATRQKAFEYAQHQAKQTVFETAGGEELYSEMTKWAATGLTAEDRDAYNAIINTADPAQVKIAVEGLKSRFVAANGIEPKLANGRTLPTGVKPYASDAEMVADMSKPEYRNDPAFRAKVEARLAVS
jgi:hypothetical protein